MATDKKYIYFFGKGKADGTGTMKDLLGGKGAGLAEMTNAGVPVPPGFTITTEVCNLFYEIGNRVPQGLDAEMREYMKRVEDAVSGFKFGDVDKPLLVSVRSGSKFSMPGMMDTVLNLGLNDKTIRGLIRMSGNERFAWDAYRRFIQMFGNVVMGIEKDVFEHIIHEVKKKRKVHLDIDLTAEDLCSLRSSDLICSSRPISPRAARTMMTNLCLVAARRCFMVPLLIATAIVPSRLLPTVTGSEK